MSPSRKQRSCAIASFLATAVGLGAAPGAFAATTVTYNQGGTSPGMNIVDDPGNAVHLVVTSGTFNNHVGVRSNNRIGCRGRLAAGAPRRALGRRTRYRLRRGATARVTVRVPRALRRAAARRNRVPARVVSIETGSHGPKLTIRPMLLR